MGPSRGDRVAEIVLFVIFIAIPVVRPIKRAVQVRSPTSVLVAVLCVLLEIVLVMAILHLRRQRQITEEEMTREIDKAMGTPSDDPRQMGRYVP